MKTPNYTLVLTIKKRWFDMIASGEKQEEYRKDSKWICSRLHNDPKFVLFRNGYHKDSPTLLTECYGYTFGIGNHKWGAPLHKVFKISIGKIIKRTP